MGSNVMEATFTETTLANAETAIDAYIAAIWAAVGASQDNITVDLEMLVVASDDSTSYTFHFDTILYDTTATLVLAMIGDYMIGVAATVDESDFDAITAVTGTVEITVVF